MNTVWVFGDQLNRNIGALQAAQPNTHRVLIIESAGKIASRPWHIQRAHFLVTSMRRFALALEQEGFQVDYRKSATMRQGVNDHIAEFSPTHIDVTEPNSYTARQLVSSLGIQTTASNQFLCHPTDFAKFAEGKKSMKMEDFYRWQRKRYEYLMEGDKRDQPVGGQWNFDEDNRLPPPKTGHDRWPVPQVHALDDIDQQVLNDLPKTVWGVKPTGLWATTREGALARLHYFINEILPTFGEHEDAMLESNWHLAHSLLSPYLNNGLLLPNEVLDAAAQAFSDGKVPINSAEGFIRQILGWREYIWNCYWRWMPDYAQRNHLQAHRPLPPLFTNPKKTQMKCMSTVLNGVNAVSYTHLTLPTIYSV